VVRELDIDLLETSGTPFEWRIAVNFRSYPRKLAPSQEEQAMFRLAAAQEAW
jgi:hypothetical protein